MAALPLAVELDTGPQRGSSDLRQQKTDVAVCLLGDSDSQKDGHPPRLWEPFFLRRSTILSFIATFVALLSAIVALYCYAARGDDGKQGIETQGWKYYYLWTFGPTAGLFLLLGLFIQITGRDSNGVRGSVYGSGRLLGPGRIPRVPINAMVADVARSSCRI